jgi:hydrogenase expression/formation protein HypC
MCLAIPGKVIEIKDNIATIDYEVEKREASTALKPEAKIGDYVIVSNKFVMEIVPEEEALKSIETWKQVDSK